LSPTRLRQIIAWIQIAGAAWGASISYGLYRQVHGTLIILAGAFTLFFTLIGAAGVLLLRNHRWGVPLSLVSQGIQIPVLMSPGPSFFANAGLGARFTFSTDGNIGFYIHLGTQLHYSWQSEQTTTTVGINVVAAVLLYLLIMRVEEPSAAPPPSGAA
jgi:DMSO/TMAO reductase YedYZ heme-binding membrane subunit